MTLREMLDFFQTCARQVGHDISAETVRAIEAQIVHAFPAEKVYVPRPVISKKARIIEDARRLPTSVVAVRHGVTRQYVNRVVKK